MSAQYDETQGFSFVISKTLHPEDETILSCMFDEATDFQEVEIMKEMQESVLIRKVCLVKTLLFPYEWLLTRLILDKEHAKDRASEQSVYWKFLRKKITLVEFKSNLMKLMEN